jgi:hypothetical protein
MVIAALAVASPASAAAELHGRGTFSYAGEAMSDHGANALMTRTRGEA